MSRKQKPLEKRPNRGKDRNKTCRAKKPLHSNLPKGASTVNPWPNPYLAVTPEVRKILYQRYYSNRGGDGADATAED